MTSALALGALVADDVYAHAQHYPTKETWLEARRQGLGASDSAAVLGVSPFASPLSLYHEKLGLIDPDRADHEGFLLDLGVAMEPVIAQMLERELGRPVLLTSRITGGPIPMLRHATDEWLTATIDAWTTDDAGEAMPVELKNVSLYVAGDWLKTGEVPTHYQVQVQHQLAVLNRPRALVAALIGGTAFRWAAIDRDEELIAILRAQAGEFWRRILEQDPPPPDDHAATLESLRAVGPTATPTAVAELPVDWDIERQTAKRDLKAAERRVRAADAQILAALQAKHANIAVMPNGAQYTWKYQQRAAFTVAASSFPVLRRRGGPADDNGLDE